MQHHKMTGIILRSRPQGERDRIIWLFSPEYGLVRMGARGVRNIKSRRSPHIDILNYVMLDVETSKNGKLYLREAHAQSVYTGMKQAPQAYAAACVIASFMMKIIPEGATHPALFSVLKKTFAALEESAPPEKTLRTFFLKTMRLLGYIPERLRQADLERTLSERLAHLDPDFTVNARRTLAIFSR